MLVLLAHAGVPGFTAGFVGVDMFFVISGYLITQLIQRELAATGRLNYFAFYARRVKRLLPAFATMLVVVALACQVALTVELQAEAAQAGFWASLWLSNIHFATARLEYFDDAAQQNVFTHTWSLGVEEQFYLVWPLLLVAIFRKWHGWTATWIAVIGLASFALCLWAALRDANAAYYLMPTRLWQLAAGAWAGIVVWRKERWSLYGLGIAILMLWLLDESKAYPSMWAILPVASTMLLLQQDSGSGWGSLWLGSAPLRFVGRISYSLYLWHWPILVLGGIVWPLGGWSAVAIAVLASIMVATLSERWVERPIRHAGFPDQRVLAVGLLVTLAIVVMMGLWQASTWSRDHGLITRQGEAEDANLLAGRITVPEVYKTRGFDQNYESDEFMPLLLTESQPKGAKRVLLAGDSILMQWEPAFSRIARQRGWALVAATKSACPMLDVRYVNERIKRRYVECERWRDALVAHVGLTKPDILIIGSASTYPFDDAAWVTGTRSLLSKLVTSAGKIVILAPPPLLPFRPLDCVVAQGEVTSGELEAEGCSAPLEDARQERVARLLVQATRGMPNVVVVTLDEVVCPDGECWAVTDGDLVFRDTVHLNADFVAERHAEVSSLLVRSGIR